jgi:hypothetical protein
MDSLLDGDISVATEESKYLNNLFPTGRRVSIPLREEEEQAVKDGVKSSITMPKCVAEVGDCFINGGKWYIIKKAYHLPISEVIIKHHKEEGFADHVSCMEAWEDKCARGYNHRQLVWHYKIMPLEEFALKTGKSEQKIIARLWKGSVAYGRAQLARIMPKEDE